MGHRVPCSAILHSTTDDNIPVLGIRLSAARAAPGVLAPALRHCKLTRGAVARIGAVDVAAFNFGKDRIAQCYTAAAATRSF